MNQRKKTRRILKPLDLSRTAILSFEPKDGEGDRGEKLVQLSTKYNLAGVFNFTEGDSKTDYSEHPIQEMKKDALSDQEGIADYFIAGNDLNVNKVHSIIQRLEKRSKPRTNTVYLGKDNGQREVSGKFTRLTQKALYDLDIDLASSGIFVCTRETLRNLLESLPPGFGFDNSAIKYVAERSQIRVRTIACSTGITNFDAGGMGLIKRRLGMMYKWYLQFPFHQLKAGQWWKKPQAWGHDNVVVWRMMFSILAIITFLGMPSLSFDYGVTWDEKIENDYGKDALNYLLSGGEDRRCFDESIHLYAPMRNYGMLFNVASAAVSKFISPLGEFETKHFLNALTGFLAILFIGLIAKNIGGWRMGFLTLLFLLLSPRFFGHSMTNPKDIPFAAGYVIGVWAIIKVFEELPKPRWRTIFWAVLGIGFVMGIRIGGLMVLCYLVMMMGLHWLGHVRDKGFSKSWALVPRYAGYLAVVTIGSYLIAIATWPYALEGPIEHPLEALSAITNVQYIVSYELFSGARTNMAALSWNYIPEWMAISMPVFVLLGFLLSPASLMNQRSSYKFKMLLFCLFVVVFPAAYVVYQGSVLYNGWRHFLFFAPFVALLGALGWDSLFRLKLHPYIKHAGVVVLMALVAKTTWWMTVNHPYQYVYFNELVGGIDGAYGKYETDYYGLSMREGIEWLVENENIADGRKVRVGVNCEIETANYWAKKYSENITIVWNRHYEKHKLQWDYAMFASRTMSRKELLNGSYPPKGTIHTVDVDNTPILAIIKHDNTFLHDGYEAFNQNKLPEAIELFKQAVAYDSRSEESARMLGTAYYSSSQPELAIQAFDRALEIWPESYLALYYKSQIMLQRGDYQACYDLALESIEHKSNIQGAHLNAGRSAMQLGYFEASRSHLENAFKYSGGNRNMQSDIHMLLGQSYLIETQAGKASMSPVQVTENLTNAVNQLARSIDINPKNRNALRFIVSGLEQLGDETNLQRYKQMLASL